MIESDDVFLLSHVLFLMVSRSCFTPAWRT
ncbi:Uncharacterised protein [Vibrio cholerae]|nr:Uncharacterised protein [Vibrio cholerae]